MEPRGEHAEVLIDPVSGLPTLSLGHPIDSGYVAEALDDEQPGLGVDEFDA